MVQINNNDSEFPESSKYSAEGLRKTGQIKVDVGDIFTGIYTQFEKTNGETSIFSRKIVAGETVEVAYDILNDGKPANTTYKKNEYINGQNYTTEYFDIASDGVIDLKTTIIENGNELTFKEDYEPDGVDDRVVKYALDENQKTVSRSVDSDGDGIFDDVQEF